MSDTPDLQNLFQAAQRIQSEVARVKSELASKTVDAETGGGLVRCVANGSGEIVSLTIDPSVFDPGSKKMVEDLVVGAVNVALDRAKQLAQDELVRATGGLGLPSGLFGGG